MGSNDNANGVSSHVTLQVRLASNGSNEPIQTNLDRTVEEFKQKLADVTGIPSDQQLLVCKGRVLNNPQTLRSCGLKPDQTMHLLRRGLPPSTPIFTMATESIPAFPRDTSGLNATNLSKNKPNTQPPNKSIDIKSIIKSFPILCKAAEEPMVAKMLENSVILRCVLSYLFYIEINRSEGSDEAYLTKRINAWAEEYNPECYDAGGTCFSEMELEAITDKLMETSRGHKSMETSRRHNVFRKAVNFQRILFSDAAFLRHYKNQDNSVDCAITAMLALDDANQLVNTKPFDHFSHSSYSVDMCRDQSSPGVGNPGALKNEHCNHYQKLLLALLDNEDYNSSWSSYGGSDDISPDELRSEHMLSSQLAEMEEIGFMNRQENFRALLKSGADVEKAVEWLLENISEQ